MIRGCCARHVVTKSRLVVYQMSAILVGGPIVVDGRTIWLAWIPIVVNEGIAVTPNESAFRGKVISRNPGVLAIGDVDNQGHERFHFIGHFYVSEVTLDATLD